MKENTLYIIGNGFDIYHELNTGVQDFVNILIEKEIYKKKSSVLELFEEYGVDWNEYENSLSEMDLGRIDEDNINELTYLSEDDYEYNDGYDDAVWNIESYLNGLSDALIDSLSKMIENANNDLDYKCRKMQNFIFEGDAVLSFNYTSTIERLYDIPDNIKILHIHGYFEDDEELIFGYKEGDKHKYYKEHYFNSYELEKLEKKMEEINNIHLSGDDDISQMQYYKDKLENLTDYRAFCVDMQREEIVRFYLRWKKEIQLEKLMKFLNELNDITNVYVMGHSMASVDKDYMEMIEDRLHPQNWYISQYNDKPNRGDLSHYSFIDKIRFYKMDDFK